MDKEAATVGGMKSFKHLSAPLRLFHGADSFAQLGSELDRLRAKHAMIVCGASMVRERRVLDLVRAALADRCAGVFDGVRGHSPVPAVQAAAGELKRVGADAVIALGGGSAIVTARAASILLAEQGDVRSLSTSRNAQGELQSPRLKAPKLPQFVIPTTPTSAIVKAGSALTDPSTHERLALFDPKTRAHAVFIHPDAVKTAPRELVIGASLDTFVLAVEGLTSLRGDPIADGLLMQSVRLLYRHLSSGIADDAASRGDLMLAAILCGQGTDHTGGGIATALGHAITPYSHADNGVTKAIILPHALRFNADATRDSLAKVVAALETPARTAEALGVALDAVQELVGKLGVPQRLREAGVARDALSRVAAQTMSDWWLRGNPRRVTDVAELQQVLEEAW